MPDDPVLDADTLAVVAKALGEIVDDINDPDFLVPIEQPTLRALLAAARENEALRGRCLQAKEDFVEAVDLMAAYADENQRLREVLAAKGLAVPDPLLDADTEESRDC